MEAAAKVECQCAACMASPDTSTPRQKFVAKVHREGVQAGPGFWTAWAQGHLAALDGKPIPDRILKGCHAVDFDFRRGYAAATGAA